MGPMLGPCFVAVVATTVLMFGCLARGTPSVKQALNIQGACSQVRGVMDIGVGWTVDEAQKRSPVLAHITPALANRAPTACVYEPERVELEGAIPFEVPCPHLVVMTPEHGRIVGIDIDLTPTSDLDAAMKPMGEWHGKFESMKLDPPPPESARFVTTLERMNQVLLFGWCGVPSWIAE